MTPQGIEQGPWIRQQDTDPLDDEGLQTGRGKSPKEVKFSADARDRMLRGETSRAKKRKKAA